MKEEFTEIDGGGSVVPAEVARLRVGATREGGGGNGREGKILAKE